MTSCTAKTDIRRALRKAAMGTRRKNAIKRDGTTPPLFTLNKPTAIEKTGNKASKLLKASVSVKKETVAPKKASAPKVVAAAKPATAKAAAPKTK